MALSDRYDIVLLLLSNTGGMNRGVYGMGK